MEHSGSIAAVGMRGSLTVGRVGVLHCIEVAVASASEVYSRDGGFVEGEAAIVVRHPAAGNTTEGVENGVLVEALGLGLGLLAVRTTPADEGWISWELNASCRNPTRDRLM